MELNITNLPDQGGIFYKRCKIDIKNTQGKLISFEDVTYYTGIAALVMKIFHKTEVLVDPRSGAVFCINKKSLSNHYPNNEGEAFGWNQKQIQTLIQKGQFKQVISQENKDKAFFTPKDKLKVTPSNSHEQQLSINDEETKGSSSSLAFKGSPTQLKTEEVEDDISSSSTIKEDPFQAAYFLAYIEDAEKGNENNMMRVGNTYRDKDPELAIQWYESFARGARGQNLPDNVREKMIAEAEKQLGDIYIEKLRHLPTAKIWYMKAARHGRMDAMNAVADIYDRGLYGVPQNINEAVNWYQNFVGKGYAEVKIARIYFFSKKDPIQTFFWYEKAAELGYQEAIKWLISAYEKGGILGSSPDATKAEYWRSALNTASATNPAETLSSSHSQVGVKKAAISTQTTHSQQEEVSTTSRTGVTSSPQIHDTSQIEQELGTLYEPAKRYAELRADLNSSQMETYLKLINRIIKDPDFQKEPYAFLSKFESDTSVDAVNIYVYNFLRDRINLVAEAGFVSKDMVAKALKWQAVRHQAIIKCRGGYLSPKSMLEYWSKVEAMIRQSEFQVNPKIFLEKFKKSHSDAISQAALTFLSEDGTLDLLIQQELLSPGIKETIENWKTFKLHALDFAKQPIYKDDYRRVSFEDFYWEEIEGAIASSEFKAMPWKYIQAKIAKKGFGLPASDKIAFDFLTHETQVASLVKLGILSDDVAKITNAQTEILDQAKSFTGKDKNEDSYTECILSVLISPHFSNDLEKAYRESLDVLTRSTSYGQAAYQFLTDSNTQKLLREKGLIAS